MNWAVMSEWLAPIFVVLLGLVAGYALHAVLFRAQLAREAREAEQTVRRARDEAERIRREAELAAREEVLRAREAFEAENASRRQHLTVAEQRLAARQDELDRRAAMLEKRTQWLDQREANLQGQAQEFAAERKRLEALAVQADQRLAEVAALSRDEARQLLLDRLTQELELERAAMVRRYQKELEEHVGSMARRLLIGALERYAAEQANHVTTTSITLADEELKGRIIGREGRNIRALERETGCTFIIDEAPKTIVISTFDPVRREIARRAIELLVADGRIQPARIEEVVAEVRRDMERVVREAGERAVGELRLTGVSPELLPLLGTLQFRTSFAQNVLQHSVEVGHLAGMLAAELGLDPAIARRVGLFHDIGKALSHAVEGPHATVGADVLRRHGEPPVVWEAVAAHHHELVTDNPYASIVSAADTLTAARPGARVDSTEFFLRRMAKLEEIATSFPGVRQCYAMQAGREIRVFVVPEEVSDAAALLLARDISRKIQSEMPVVGQTKVTVIRETRCIEYVR